MTMTTAQTLSAYRRELLDGGMNPEVVDDLVKDAAQTMVMNQGLRVLPASTGETLTIPSHP